MFNNNTLSTKKTISRFTTLAFSGWLCIAFMLCGIYLFSYLKLNFKTQFTTINSYLAIYQHQTLLLSIAMSFIVLWLIICSLRCLSFQVSSSIKIPLLIIPLTLLASIIWLSHNLYLLIVELNIPLGQGIFALRKYFNNYSHDLLLNAISTLPYQLNSIKIPTYTAIYSYMILCVMMISFPFKLEFRVKKLWIILNSIPTLLFLIIIALSFYYLIRDFIIHDPFDVFAQQLAIFLSR